MPTYVYECSNCNTVFEAEQRITEAPLESCECGSKGTVKRLIQPVAVSFKGAGFHINDYATTGSAAAKTEESSKPTEACSGEPASCPTCAPKPAAE